MAGKGIIEMSLRELKRLKVIQEAIDKHITQNAAGMMIGLSERQVRRLVKAVRAEGDGGIIHKYRGRPSNRRIPEKIKARAIALYKRKYPDFGPTLASEKLSEDGITLSAECLRRWLIEASIWQKRRKRSEHRRWRERKECFGQMVQMDGSHHDWLEGRGPELVLMGYIDDATNTIFARFYDYEGTIPAMDSFSRYIRKYGLPQSVYLDRHTTYKSTRKLTVSEYAQGLSAPLSQFERALKELGVEIIHAYSPQAKGRVERLFGVLQDRLVKEMRLRGTKTKEEANEVIEEYLPGHNRKFRTAAVNSADMHTRLPKYFNLSRILCKKTERTIKGDNTVALDGRLFQIEENVPAKKVILEERLDGSLHIMAGDIGLKYKEIAERPKPDKTIVDRRVWNRPPIPAKNHPWRRDDDWSKHPKRRIYPY